MKKLLSIILALMLLICLTAFTASAEDTTEPVVADHPHTASSTHCACGDDNATFTGHTHAAETWTAWTNGMASPTSGSYYLAEDVTINATISVTGNFKLCLNGYTLTVTNGARAFTNAKGNHRELSICDCSEGGTGKITTNNSSNQGGVIYWFRGYIYLYSGTLENTSDSMAVSGGVIRLGQQGASGAAASRDIQFYMYGGKINGATTTNDGGSIYGGDSTKLQIHLLGGEITGGSAANGGNIYLANGSLVVDGCTISGGSATNGGNIYVTAGTEATIDSGTISGGKAEAGDGGNIVVYGTLNMNGGSVYSGTCKGNSVNGGNVYVNNGSFTMTGGTIGSAEGNSLAEGTGYNLSFVNSDAEIIGGRIWGYARFGASAAHTLDISGTPDISGAGSNLNIAVADAANCTFTVGKLEEGANIWLAYQNIDANNAHGGIFATAAADFAGAEYLHCNKNLNLVAINTDDGIMWTGIQDTDGNGYASVDDAAAAGKVVTLKSDVANETITKDVTLDLNGKKLTNVTIDAGATVKGIDTTTNQYQSTNGTITLSDGSAGSVAPFYKHNDGNIRRYVAIEDNGSYSFNRYYMAVTAVSIAPKTGAFSYKVSFLGNEAVANAVNNKTLSVGAAFTVDNTKTVDYVEDGEKTFVKYGGDEKYNEYKILVDNVLEGDAASNVAQEVTAKAYITSGETTEYSSEVTRSFNDVLKKADEAYNGMADGTLKTALLDMFMNNRDSIATWDSTTFPNLYAAAEAAKAENA